MIQIPNQIRFFKVQYKYAQLPLKSRSIREYFASGIAMIQEQIFTPNEHKYTN